MNGYMTQAQATELRGLSGVGNRDLGGHFGSGQSNSIFMEETNDMNAC